MLFVIDYHEGEDLLEKPFPLNVRMANFRHFDTITLFFV